MSNETVEIRHALAHEVPEKYRKLAHFTMHETQANTVMMIICKGNEGSSAAIVSRDPDGDSRMMIEVLKELLSTLENPETKPTKVVLEA